MSITVWTNNASAPLAGSITSSQTTITVAPGTGAQFPNPTSGEFFPLTLISAVNAGIFEIAYCTARTTDTLTVVRGEEGTTAQAFNSGDFANLQLTAGTIPQPGRLLNIQIFASPGTFTYTPTAGARSLIVEVQGGCGGSAGIPATGSGQFAFSPGANSGGYAIGEYLASSQTVVVGVAGAGGTAGGGAGGNGGASSYGSLMTADGGAGSASSGPASFAFFAAQATTIQATTMGGNIVNLSGTTELAALA
jgi:hypothetical protein